MALDSFRRKEERFHILNFCIKKPEEEEGENTLKLTGKKESSQCYNNTNKIMNENENRKKNP